MAKTQTAAAKKADAKTPAQKGQTKPPRQVPPGTMSATPKLEAAPPVEVPVEQRHGERRQQQANDVAKFTASTMQAPAVHAPELTPEQKKAQEFQAAVAKLAAEMGVQLPAVQAKAPRAPSNRLQQNGVTRPASGTTTGQIWDIADQISASQHGSPALISQLKAHEALKQTNDHTLKTQYARWRQFHGIKGRIQVVQVPSGSIGIYPEALPNIVGTPAAQQ